MNSLARQQHAASQLAKPWRMTEATRHCCVILRRGHRSARRRPTSNTRRVLREAFARNVGAGLTREAAIEQARRRRRPGLRQASCPGARGSWAFDVEGRLTTTACLAPTTAARHPFATTTADCRLSATIAARHRQHLGTTTAAHRLASTTANSATTAADRQLPTTTADHHPITTIADHHLATTIADRHHLCHHLAATTVARCLATTTAAHRLATTTVDCRATATVVHAIITARLAKSTTAHLRPVAKTVPRPGLVCRHASTTEAGAMRPP